MLQESTLWKVAGVFFNEPTQDHYLKEISRKAGLAHTSVKVHLHYLLQAGILLMSKEKRGTREFPTYKANLDVGCINLCPLRVHELMSAF